MIEEREQSRNIEIGQAQRRGLDAGRFAQEQHEESERVSVRGDGLRARLLVREQVLGEKRL